MPDKYPLSPGHILIIAKEHLACYGAATAEIHRELDDVAAHVRRFLFDFYAKPVFTWENGVEGQSVFHAHLHLIPLDVADVPADLEAHRDVASIDGWHQVAEHYRSTGVYHYLELGHRRLLIAGQSSAIGIVHRTLAQATGLSFGPTGWHRTTTPDDVVEVAQQWTTWVKEAGRSR